MPPSVAYSLYRSKSASKGQLHWETANTERNFFLLFAVAQWDQKVGFPKNPSLRCVYIKAKATSLPICYIVSNLCVYTTAMCKRQKIKEKNRFRSNIKEPLSGVALLYFKITRLENATLASDENKWNCIKLWSTWLRLYSHVVNFVRQSVASRLWCWPPIFHACEGLFRQSFNGTDTGTNTMSNTSHSNLNGTGVTPRDYCKFPDKFTR